MLPKTIKTGSSPTHNLALDACYAINQIIEHLAEAPENAAPSGQIDFDLLSGLVELKPLITNTDLGAEPSIKELVQNYYRDHDMEDWEGLTEQYLKELFNMAT